MAELQRAEHHVLGQFLGLGFHHQHAFARAGDDEVELGGIDLGRGRVQHVLAVDVADAGGADRAEEGDAGQGKGCRAADHGDDVGVVLEVMAEHGGHHLHLVAEAGGEQRADRPVDQAGDQGLLLGGPALALEEAAGDLAGGEGLLLVVHGQREEILPRLGGAHADGGAQHDGVAVAGEHRAVGLAGDLAGFQDQLAAAPVEFLAEIIEHRVVSLMGMRCNEPLGAGPLPVVRKTASRAAWGGPRREVGVRGAGAGCPRQPCCRKRRAFLRWRGRERLPVGPPHRRRSGNVPRNGHTWCHHGARKGSYLAPPRRQVQNRFAPI